MAIDFKKLREPTPYNPRDPFHFANRAYRAGEQVIAVTGHRPDKLGGYGEHSRLRLWVRACLREEMVLWALRKTTVFLSGMALGVDTDWARAAVELGYPFVAVVPFEGQDRVWRPEQQATYRELLGKAREVIVVSDGGYTPEAMKKRNTWMVKAASAVVAVWDGSSGGTGHCVNEARHHGTFVSRIDPRDFPGDKWEP